MSGKLDTKSATTITRAGLNDRYARHDLEDWIFSQVELFNGMKVLDIGCGGGKQLFRLAKTLSADSRLLGVDVSEGAVSSVRELAAGQTNIEARQMNFDDCLLEFAAESFDLILSTYAIYYAADMVALLAALRGLLKTGGRVFVSGPGAGTNAEIIALINRHAARKEDNVETIADFIDPQAIDSIRSAYADTRMPRLDNYIDFPDVESVMLWWRSHNCYRAALDGAVADGVQRIIARHGRFRLSKPVLGVRLDA